MERSDLLTALPPISLGFPWVKAARNQRTGPLDVVPMRWCPQAGSQAEPVYVFFPAWWHLKREGLVA